jgi:hypothetical protein
LWKFEPEISIFRTETDNNYTKGIKLQKCFPVSIAGATKPD